MARPLTASLTVDGKPVKLPPAWQSPMRDKDGTRKPLYQCVVETRDKGPIAVGPARVWEQTENFAQALAVAIKTGKITGWGSPTVVRIS